MKNKKYKISGHETFALRYAWLPKCVKALAGNPDLFSDEDQAMVDLGVGKNMVRSIRFWGEMTGVIEPDSKRRDWIISSFGKTLLDSKSGLDPFLEDDQTLWLLHWKLSTRDEPLFAWDFLLNHWHEPELIPSVLVSTAKRELESDGVKVSASSLKSHFLVFFHSYFPTKGSKGSPEESLDSPLVEISFLEQRCKKVVMNDQMETVFAFDRDEKSGIGDALFLYCILDFWRKTSENENTLSFRQIAHGIGSPGQIFKLNDNSVRTRLEIIGNNEKLPVQYSDSSLIQCLTKEVELSDVLMNSILEEVYAE